MLDFPASPSILPPTGQTSETSDLTQTPVQSGSEAGAEGFPGLLASLEPVTGNQGPMTGAGEFAGLLTVPDLPESGMMLPHDIAADALLLPPGAVAEMGLPATQDGAEATIRPHLGISRAGLLAGGVVPEASALGQASLPEGTALPGLPPTKPLVLALRSMLTPKAPMESEHWQPGLAGSGEFRSDQRSGFLHPLIESGVGQDRPLDVIKAMESMPSVRPPIPGGGELLSVSAPLAQGGQSAAAATAEQPSAVKLPAVNVTVGEKGWDQLVGERITWMLGSRVQQAEVRLSPPHLGPLEMRVSVHNDQASVSFAAPHALTREAIEAAIPRLREMMAEGNLNLVNVNVADRGSGQHNAPGDSGRGQDEGAAQAQIDLPADDLSDPEIRQTRIAATTLLDDYA